ncbi:MAG: hypothetical protein U1E23_10250 [Reyranellaceae bacterium]
MDYAVVISAVVLGLSVLASAAKFLDWFLHSDPRTMVRTTRWLLLLLLLAGVPVLVLAVAREQWPLAMLVGAGMLTIATFLGWGKLLTTLRGALATLRRRPNPFDMEVWQDSPDAEKVRQAAALLDAYLRRNAPPRLEALPAPRAGSRGMTREEALDVLGLPGDADEVSVRGAHQRLLELVHTDRGGSPGLMACVHEARDVLLDTLSGRRNVA